MRMLDGMEMAQTWIFRAFDVTLKPIINPTEDYIEVAVVINNVNIFDKQEMEYTASLAEKYNCEVVYKDNTIIYR